MKSTQLRISLLIKNNKVTPTHFKVIRAVSSELINYIPNSMISDFHLDSYVIHFYRYEKELTIKTWLGIEKYSLLENKKYPIHKLSEINHQ